MALLFLLIELLIRSCCLLFFRANLINEWKTEWVTRNYRLGSLHSCEYWLLRVSACCAEQSKLMVPVAKWLRKRTSVCTIICNRREHWQRRALSSEACEQVRWWFDKSDKWSRRSTAVISLLAPSVPTCCACGRRYIIDDVTEHVMRPRIPPRLEWRRLHSWELSVYCGLILRASVITELAGKTDDKQILLSYDVTVDGCGKARPHCVSNINHLINWMSVLYGMPTIQHSSRNARLSVHKLFISCIRRGLVSRDLIVDGALLPATEWCQRYLPLYCFSSTLVSHPAKQLLGIANIECWTSPKILGFIVPSVQAREMTLN